MLEQVFSILEIFENSLWSCLGGPLVILLGLYLSIQSRFAQIRKFPKVVKTFVRFLTVRERDQNGVHPLKAFFACVGGCVGVGNVVGICTAVQIGGPGSLFWIWVTAAAGMMIKYSEVYLGLRYRVANSQGSYDGGPMYFLQKVFKKKWVPYFVAFLLCIYGVEVYQFSIVTNSISHNLNVNPCFIIFPLLLLVMFAGSGGVRRVGSISSGIIPFFVIIYVGMGGWVLFNNLSVIPEVLGEVFASAFTGHGAVGGFVGSTLIMAMSQGVRRGCYTTDVGVGYASVIHSESSAHIPEKQAALVIFDIFVDTFMICTTSVLIILVTGIWQEPLEAGLLVQSALANYFPYMHIFMPIFLLLLAYNTINAYFCVGLKCAQFLAPRFGRPIYYVYAMSVILLFSFFDPSKAQTIMTIVGGLLLVINCYGIFRLRHEISYNLDYDDERVVEPAVAEYGVEVRVQKSEF